MRMVDLIHKKRLGEELTKAQLEWLITQYVAGEIPDYQMSALAMAICFQGMTDVETTDLTMAMVHSGKTVDWSGIPGVKVDKHSTGGVGDTTTLVIAPLVAAVGVPMAKMSGRGLGHTGGTIDKLESIPGFSTELGEERFQNQVKAIGIAVAAQTTDLAPADKKLYALRDVTDTVESLPLIASSIMSKKLASGADAIVLDVKVGRGAFMKDLEHARELASAMVSIGRLAGRQVRAVLTQMDQPLGKAIGNALEVREAILTLRGQGPADLTELCLTLGAQMVVLAGKAQQEQAARSMLEKALSDGSALAKFKEFLAAQGGDARVVDDLSLLPRAPVLKTLHAQQTGVLKGLDAQAIGLIAMRLGAGRALHGDIIDPAVGLVLQRKVGERVVAGEPLVEVHASTDSAAEAAIEALRHLIHIEEGSTFVPNLILEVMTGGARPDDLLAHAVQAREKAYVPYSRFAVGAALRLTNGDVVTGVNVENASYGLTNCAERTAVFRYVASGAYDEGAKIQEIAVVADSEVPVAPCGACRQVLVEFCEPDTPVVLADMHGGRQRTTVQQLLPYSFSADQMRTTTKPSDDNEPSDHNGTR